MRTRSGLTAFSAIEISSLPAKESEILWSEAAARFQPIYGAAVEAGFRWALDAHQRRGGPPQHIKVVSLAETTSDTKPDAVQCAAALALWKALGHEDGHTTVEFANGTWKVTFS